MSSTLGIRLLGGFSLIYGEHQRHARGERPVVNLSSGRAQALLAYLVLHRQAAQSRQQISFHLWPESTDAQARANLRKELSRLRHALPSPDEYLAVDTRTLQWLPHGNFSLDVIEFETAAKAAEQATDKSTIQAQLEQAIEQYRGNLLPDLDDEWVLPERERLQQKYVWALERLVILLEEQSNYRSALAYAQQLLRLDAFNEAAYALLMRLHGLMGDRAKALQVYHQCMTVLREELGVDPSLSTRRLYEHLLMAEEDTPKEDTPRHRSHSNANGVLTDLPRPPSVPHQAHLAPYPLVGREQEWSSIQQWAGSVLGGDRGPIQGTETNVGPKVLLLLGEPGIGKTRLLEELQALTQENHAQVLWGTGFVAEMMRPYGIWIDALRSSAIASTTQVPSELGFLLPELGQPSQAPPDPSHLFDAVVQLLMKWAKQGPLLVLLDDIQWLDEASSGLLHYAIRLLRPLPVLFAFTARSGELTVNAAIARVVQALRREQRLHTLEVHPLDRAQTADLIRSTYAISSGRTSANLSSELSVEVVNQVFIDSGGNPLFALEIARAIGQHPPTPANTVEALIRDRLHQLDDTTHEVLPWAAALGRSFNPSTIAHVADYPVTKLLTAIEQLEQQMIIRPGTSLGGEIGYDFAHDIVRRVVYQQLSEPRRQLIHRQIAHKLHQRFAHDDTVAGDIAHHASQGGDYALAASAALAAAERCLKLFAYTEALELAQRGIQYCQSLDPQPRLLHYAALLRVCALAGVTGDRAAHLEAEVQQCIQEAKSLGLNEAEVIALEALIMLQFDRSDFTGVHQHVLRVAEASRITSPAMTARILAYSGSCLAEIGQDLIRAEALLLEAQSLADRVGLELGDLFGGLGCVHRHYGRYDEARSLLQKAWHLIQAQQDHWRECNCISYLAMLELEAGNPMAALPYCDEILLIAAKIQGEGSETAIATALAALAHYQLRHPHAEAALTEAIANLQQLDAKRMLAYVLIGAATVDLHCDRPDLAVNRAEAALQNAQIVNHPSEIALSWAILIQGLLALGVHQQATDQLQQLQQQINHYDLSLPAQKAVNRVMQPMQTQLSSVHKSLKQT